MKNRLPGVRTINLQLSRPLFALRDHQLLTLQKLFL